MNEEIKTMRNVALAGHGGAGKTTLAEAMLFKAGVTNRLEIQSWTFNLKKPGNSRVLIHLLLSIHIINIQLPCWILLVIRTFFLLLKHAFLLQTAWPL